jgi:hypothetical protein
VIKNGNVTYTDLMFTQSIHVSNYHTIPRHLKKMETKTLNKKKSVLCFLKRMSFNCGLNDDIEKCSMDGREQRITMTSDA